MDAENTTYSEDFITQAAITLTSATLSLMGGMILIFTYLLISEFQTSVHRLLVFLTFTDILSAFGYILGTVYYLLLDSDKRNSTDHVYEAQSFITTFSCLASFDSCSSISSHQKTKGFSKKLDHKRSLSFYRMDLPGILLNSTFNISVQKTFPLR